MINNRFKLRALTAKILIVCFVFLMPTLASAVRVIEEQAIPFTGFLSKADFDQRFPGKEVNNLTELDPGWYVIYEHESLSYYFGPILLQSTGQDYLDELTQTVDAAVAQRPSIEGYRLELSYEPSESTSNSEDLPPAVQTPQAPPTPPPSGLWGFIRRIFGF